jgi:NADH dehydrogenase
MPILVAGATGQLGGLIARRLLEQGQDVRMLVRPQSDYQALVHAGGRPVPGDLKNRASLDAACQEIDTVITTANSAQRGGADTPQTVDLEGNRHLIDAAKAAGVRQFIFTSALGVDPSSPMPFLRAKAQSETYLRDSGMPLTILAPNIFMEVWMGMVIGLALRDGRPVMLVGEGRRKHTFISMQDVAAFATAAVGHPAALDQYLPLGGPQALSFHDAVAIFERGLGRSIPVESVAPGEAVPGLPDAVQPLYWAMETYDSPLEMEQTAQTFGVHQTTLEEYVRRTFAATRA